jgi:hypothetical protein
VTLVDRLTMWQLDKSWFDVDKQCSTRIRTQIGKKIFPQLGRIPAMGAILMRYLSRMADNEEP